MTVERLAATMRIRMSITDLQHLADLLRRRNAVDAEISALIDRPALSGQLGEWIASRIFDLDLHESATHRGSDGLFRSGPLQGKSMNVKVYGFQDGLFDTRKTGASDLYLVLTGLQGAPLRSAQRLARAIPLSPIPSRLTIGRSQAHESGDRDRYA